MFPPVDLDSIQFLDPPYIWLLVVPAALMPVWLWQAIRRRRDARRLERRWPLPIVERGALFGSWLFWLCVMIALALSVVALARPRAAVASVRTAGIDLIVLQDGSASMYVGDVSPNRWQRATRFLRVLAEALRWEDDRIALALFARIAAPQVRLTRDPNTFFFFLDHLDRESPFPLEDDTTWDTNIELGLYWGTRLFEKDEELNGRSGNAKAFVLVSDGQAWSGDVERALQLARARDIPVFAVGVGTLAGGYIPETPVPVGAGGPAAVRMSPLHSALDRSSLFAVASAGGGQYFDLDRQPDRILASTIVDAVRRTAGPRGIEPIAEELYWPCLLAGACLLCASVLFLQDRTELWLHAVGAGLALLVVWTLVR